MQKKFDFEAQFEQAILTLVSRFDDFQAIRSGYVVEKIDFLDVYTAEYLANGGSTASQCMLNCQSIFSK